jgi:cytochrome c oxidase subunit 1
MYNENWARLYCLIIFVGFNLTFFPQFILGTRGMPRRYARYQPEFQALHQLSTVGALLLGVGLVGCAVVLARSLWKGRYAPANPWGSATLEWKCASPPPHHNFEAVPAFGRPYDFGRIAYDADQHGYYDVPLPAAPRLPETEPGREPAST